MKEKSERDESEGTLTMDWFAHPGADAGSSSKARDLGARDLGARPLAFFVGDPPHSWPRSGVKVLAAPVAPPCTGEDDRLG